MTFFWISLKSCTHAHTKHNIRPRCTKVKEGSYHGAIYLLIHILSSLIKVKMSIGWHGVLDGLGVDAKVDLQTQRANTQIDIQSVLVYLTC
jgi:hypothetical protein